MGKRAKTKKTRTPKAPATKKLSSPPTVSETEARSICIECAKHPSLKRFVKKYGTTGHRCGICRRSDLVSSAPAEYAALSSLVRALIRFHYDQWTETHELVAYDTDPHDLAGTTIALTTLGEWCARIRSSRLFVVLDCCFSGGMGAKALEVDGVPRDIQSVEGKLNQISGHGRVVLRASGPTKRAWESARLGHGFLTLHLLEGLRGPEGVRDGERIGVLRLLDYVVRRVVDAAQQIRRGQHPAVRGTFDGEFTWPILTPGPIYRAAFPEQGDRVATAGIASLANFGFPEAVLAAFLWN